MANMFLLHQIYIHFQGHLPITKCQFHQTSHLKKFTCYEIFKKTFENYFFSIFLHIFIFSKVYHDTRKNRFHTN